MKESQNFQSSQKQDYVLTSYRNQSEADGNYLILMSPNNYQLNYKEDQIDAKTILSSSPKKMNTDGMTLYPLDQGQKSLESKRWYEFESQNKQNIQSNFNLFEPLEYERMFQKKINMSEIGLSCSNKSQKSISQLSKQSRQFIQHSIQKKILGQFPSSCDDLSASCRSHQSSCSKFLSQNKGLESQNNQIDHIPVTQSNFTLRKGQILEINFPSSSPNQTNTYSSGNLNLGSTKEAQNMRNCNEFDEVLSFNQRQEVIDYFLTEEQDPNENNDSEEGMQLLSELKSELNSLINGSSQNSQASSHNSRTQTLNEVRSFGKGSYCDSAASKRCRSTCEELAYKLQELKASIEKLHFKFSSQDVQGQKNIQKKEKSSVRIILGQNLEKREKAVKKQPEIYFQSGKKQRQYKKLIYPDSKIIFSRNDDQFIEFNDEFSKILNQSHHQSISNQNHSTSEYLPDYSSDKISSNESRKSSQSQKSSFLNSQNKSQFQSSSKKFGDQKLIFQTQSKSSLPRIQIEKEAFKMSYPNFQGIDDDEDRKSQQSQQRSLNLGQSCVSSASHETSMLQELNIKLNSKFDQLFHTNQ